MLWAKGTSILLRGSVHHQRVSMSSYIGDMTKNLKIGAVAFDLNVIIDITGGKSTPDTTNPTVIEDVKITTPQKELTSDEKKLYDILGPQVKYADKIKMKLAKNAVNRTNPATNSAKIAMLGSSSRWLIAEGMGDVLDYTYNRTVRLVGVGSPVDFPDHTIQQLKSQLNQTKLAYVRSFVTMKQDEDGHDIPYTALELKEFQQQALLDMEAKINLVKNKILLVSSDESLLTLARDRGYYTCRYR